MSKLNTYYRIIGDIKNAFGQDRETEKSVKPVADGFGTDEKIEMTRTTCNIDATWVEEIENGLTFIEKAINEQRQFIRSNGEILSIEKVRNVSRESVEHLARHSNFITKEQPEGEDLTPDQLYTVERLSDYAVYENKFLYMLLCYLRDFISVRYNKILELSNTYKGEVLINKIVTTRKRRLNYRLELKEDVLDDENLSGSNKNKEMIDRIDLCLKAVMVFLSTPLMEEISKHPVLKPPITKTNVLKMNNNFKGAVRLYDYIMSYQGDGFTVETITKTISPFSEEMSVEFSESLELQSFLVYEYALSLKGVLRSQFEEEKKERERLEEKRQIENLRALEKKVKESGVGMEEYMLALEKRNRTLENDGAQLALSKQEIERLGKEIGTLNQTIAGLNRDIVSLNDEMRDNERKHRVEIAEIGEQHAENIKAIEDAHAAEIEKVNAAAEERIIEKEREFELKNSTLVSSMTALREDMERLRRDNDALIDKTMKESDEAIDKMRSDMAEKLRSSETAVKQAEDDALSFKKKYEALVEKTALNEGRLNALRHQLGYTAELEDRSSEEAFNELEAQYNAFKKLFNSEWKKAKKSIVKTAFKKAMDEAKEELAVKKEKPQKEKNGGLDAAIAVSADEAENVSGEKNIAEVEAAAFKENE